MKKKLIDLFIYSGIEPSQFRRIESSLQEENRVILRIMSPVAAFLFFALVVGAFFSETMMSRLWLYLLGFLTELTIFFLSRSRAKNNPDLTLFLSHSFTMILYVFGFAMDMFSRPYDPSVSFVVVLVICQIVFNIRPIQSGGCSFAVMLLFLIVGYQIKAPYAMLEDLLNLTCFWCAGLALNLLLSNVRARSHWGMVEQRRQREEIAHALKAADEANMAKTAFLSNMSHDIRTPMNAIVGYTNLLEKTLDAEDTVQNNYIDKIKVSSNYLMDLLDNVLEISRIESGRVDLEYEAHDIRVFMDSIHILISEDIKKKKQIFQCEYRAEHPYVYIDPVKLREVTLNILGNAVKYTPNDNKISLILDELPSNRPGFATYRITVADNGIGIGKEFLPHIFDLFSRERNTTESSIVGFGLGMGIVKKLVDLMGGTISVESEVGKGTTVFVEFSFRIADQSQVLETMKTPSLPEREINLKNTRILLAEDNDLNAEITMDLLHEEAEIPVDRVSDGAQCVERLTQVDAGYYDLILMDIQMPVMDGYEATDHIRHMEDPQKRDIPIIAMTANAFKEERTKAINAGINGYVTKPIDLNTLISCIVENIK